MWRTRALAPVSLGWVGTGATRRMRSRVPGSAVLKPILQAVDGRLECVPRDGGDGDRDESIERQERERLVSERRQQIGMAQAARDARQHGGEEEMIHGE